MNFRDLRTFFFLEIFAIFWAGAVFKIFESRLLAGSLAGAYFLGLGFYILYRIFNWKRPYNSITLYPALVHVLAVSLPMIVVRFMNPDRNFNDIKIMGLEGPVFHQLSTVVFSVLILATVIDGWRAWKNN